MTPVDPEREADEKALILAAQGGDEAAFGEILRMHQDRLYGFALRFMKDRQEAQDAVQETFMALHKHLASLEPRRPLAAWLFTVCANLCRSRLRRRKIVRFLTFSQFETGDRDLPPDWASDAPDPAENAESGENLGRLHALILALPEGLRMPLVLRHFHGAADEEIASILGLSLSNVRVRLHRAKERLWKEYSEVRE